MSLLAYIDNRFIVELSVNSHEVYQLCRNNSAKKLTNKVYEIPEKKILGFYAIFPTLENTKVTEQVKEAIVKYEKENYDIITTSRRFPNDMYTTKPYKIQTIGINRMINSNVFGLFFEQGLGKTFCIVNTFRFRYLKDEVDNLVVVCPTAVLYSWRNEILKYSTEFVEEDILVCSSKDVEHRKCFDLDKKIYIMTYDTWKIVLTEYCEKTPKARRRIEKLKKKRNELLEQGFEKDSDQVIIYDDKISSSRHKCTCRNHTLDDVLDDRRIMLTFDECHKLGNRSSLQTKISIRERDNFMYRYLLSGTPVPKSPLQLYPLSKVLSDFIINLSYADFEESLVSKGGYNNKQVTGFKEGALKNLLDNTLGAVILRAFAKDWLDLPKQNIQYLQYDLKGSAFYDIYQNYVKELLDKTSSMKSIHYMEVKKYFLQILRFLSSPRKENPRWSVLDSQLETLIEEQDQDVIVWSYQPEVLEFLNKRYKKYKPVIVHGNNPSTDKNIVREQRKEELINNDKCKLGLFSSLVMDTGITVLNVKSMICVDIHMSTVHHFQLEKRNHRIGQTDRTNVYYLECLKEIDELASFILERDRHTNDNLFDNPDDVLIKKIKEVLNLREVKIIV